MRVLKFGGTSVGSPEMFFRVEQIVRTQALEDRLILVISAMTGVTDALEAIGRNARNGIETLPGIHEIRNRHHKVIDTLITNQEHIVTLRTYVDEICAELENISLGISLTNEITPRIEARLLSCGELLSSKILAEYLLETGMDATWADSRDFIVTSGKYRGGDVVEETTYQNLQALLDLQAQIIVMPGFVARDTDSSVTVLGRGGSDYTAALIAAALDADFLEIWTDVSGVMTADPRHVSSAVPIAELTYDEAMELSHFGAKVIYPPTIRPVLKKGIPIVIKNTFDPNAAGTLIAENVKASDAPLRGISHIPDIALLTLSGPGMVGVPGTAMRLFKALYASDTNVLFITQSSSEHSITVGVDKGALKSAATSIDSEFAPEQKAGAVNPVQIEEELSLVAAVGENMRHRPGIAGKLFSLLGENAVNIRAIAQGSTERNVTFVIGKRDVVKALNVLHEGFFLSPARVVHLFVIGVGNVGTEFLKQLSGQQQYLRDTYHIDLRVAGIANSRYMSFDEKGITLNEWAQDLASGSLKFNATDFVHQLRSLNLRNPVFVDNTASSEISDLYAELLNAKVHVVTSNKIAASSEFDRYEKLKKLAISSGVQFLFETNVAAGLPVIRTMRDLLLTGDRIHKVQAVLSGTMNFIFNTISDQISFSDAVAMAKEKKYTEPDPAIDLSGLDVRRKALILARESGYHLELNDVITEPFLDPSLLAASGWDELYLNLKRADKDIAARARDANAKNCRLRFLAEIDNGNAKVGLQEVDATHPAYTLSGSDNLVLLFTDRYKELPLVIRGAGAGPAVTASGVLADVLRIVNV